MIKVKGVFTHINLYCDLSKESRYDKKHIITNFNYIATMVNEIVANFAS